MTARIENAAEARPGVSHAYRTDVQGLRALAVALVVWFHLWPHAIPGGFIGVDIFFVLSGFLITSQLLQRPPTGAGDLLTFWSRRVRRLLPAALLVVFVAMMGAKLLGPPEQARFGGLDGLVTILYLQNWNLAETSANPLTAAQVPPVVQHFWSLSVEEQFYVAWPVLLIGAVLVARRQGWSLLKVCGATMAAVVVLSLTFSIFYTERHPLQAYFATPTRIWELAAGGLLAALLLHRARNGSRQIPVWVRELAVWGGFGVLVLTLITFDKNRPFPGWIALLPVLGTMAIIAGSRERGWNPNRLLGARPGLYIGDLSYSIYLWHVPLIVLWPHVTGQPIRLGDGAAIAVFSVMLAALTKRHVEDRFRYHSPRPAETAVSVPTRSADDRAPVGV